MSLILQLATVKAATVAAIGITVSAGAVAVMAGSDNPSKETEQRPPLTVVSAVVDGDTVELSSGAIVRLIGIDTPEVSQCGYQAATDKLRSLVEGKAVALVNPASVQDEDKYGRLLRYVDRKGRDAGFVLIEAGLAVARYDSRDGYDPHPRELRYRASHEARGSRCEQAEERREERLEQAQREEWRHAQEVSALAGIEAFKGEGAAHLLTRASSRLRENRLLHQRQQRQRERREAEQHRRQRQEQRQQEREQPSPTVDLPDSSGSYTGCREYAPGGATWTPIPCP